MKHKIVITRHRPALRAALIGGLAFSIALGAFVLYNYTRRTTVTEFQQTKTELEELQDERRDLTRQLRAAKAEISNIKGQLAYAQRSGQIDEQACTEIKSSIDTLQAETADLREQIAFYRGIVSPGESRMGVRVLELKISPSATKGYWRYDLVLIQSVRNDKRVAGSIQMKLIGNQGDKQQQLELKELTNAQDDALAFSFKYFQEFGGEIKFPTGFRPLRMAVTLIPQGEGVPKVDEEFEWSKMTGKAAGGAKGNRP